MGHSMKLMPAKKGTCCMCATAHEEHHPHNYWSLFYQMRFRMKYGRDATHADAVEHLPVEGQEIYRHLLAKHGQTWSEPNGDPVAEPYAESV